MKLVTRIFIGWLVLAGLGGLLLCLWGSAAWAETVPKLEMQLGHSMQSAIFSSDSRLLLSVSQSKNILWDVDSGRVLRQMGDSATTWWENIHTLSPDGKSMVSATKIRDTGKLFIAHYDVVSGKKLDIFEVLNSDKSPDIFSKDVFSPDSKMLASVSDSAINIWDVTNGHSIQVIAGHFEKVESVIFSPDGKILASVSDSAINLWDVTNGHKIPTLAGYFEKVKSFAFSPDSKMLASVSDSAIHIWDATNGQIIQILDGYFKNVESVTFSPNSKMLASGSDSTIIVWDVANWHKIQILAGYLGEVKSVVFSPDGRKLASVSFIETKISNKKSLNEDFSNKLILTEKLILDEKALKQSNWFKLWDVTSWLEVSLPDKEREVGFSLRGENLSELFIDGPNVIFSPDSNKIYVNSLSAPYILDISNNKRIEFFGDDDGTKSIDISLMVKIIVSGLRIDHIGSFSLINRIREIFLLDNFRGCYSDTFISNLISSPSNNGEPLNFNYHCRENKDIFSLPKEEAISPDGKVVAMSNENVLRLWDVDSAQLRHQFDLYGRVTSVTFSSDTRSVFVTTHVGGYEDKKNLGVPQRKVLYILDVVSGQQQEISDGKYWGRFDLVSLSSHGKLMVDSRHGNGISLNKNEHYTFPWLRDGTIKIFDVDSGRKLKSFDGDPSGRGLFAFSSDGKMVVTESDAYSLEPITLWDAESGRKLRTFGRGASDIELVIFSSDDKTVLTSSKDHTVNFWRVSDGVLLATLATFKDGSWGIVAPEGRYDASDPSNSQNLHWVVGLTPVSLDQLKDRYYEPGLLAKVMGFNKEALRPVPNLADALVKLFPEVHALVSPDQPNRIDITLTDQGGGIGPVRVRVNGKEVVEDARQGKKLSGKMVKLSVDIDPSYLLPGENPVEVIAWNADKLLRSWPARLTLDGAKARGYHGPDGKPVASLAPPPPTTLHAIVVGVSNYASPDLKLAFSGKDAANFAQALEVGAQRLFGADKVKLHLFTDHEGKGKLPARAALEEAFQQVAKEASATDILVVYLSGHGVMSAGDDGDYYYLTREAQELNLADPSVRKLWGISASELTSWVKAIKAAKQVMILDTCAAGGAAKKLTDNRMVTSRQQFALDRLHERTGFHILAGAAADKVSLESSRYSQGLLTYALLTGMKGAALRESEYVDVATLFNYAADQVPQLAIGVGGIQRPQVLTARGSTFDIGELTNEDKIRVPLAQALPMMLRASFQDEDELNDHLKLSQRFNQRVAADKYASSRGAMVFWDAEEFPEAWRIFGLYEKAGAGWKLKARLFQGDKAREPPLLLDLPSDPDKQVEMIYQAVTKMVAEGKN